MRRDSSVSVLDRRKTSPRVPTDRRDLWGCYKVRRSVREGTASISPQNPRGRGGKGFRGRGRSEVTHPGRGETSGRVFTVPLKDDFVPSVPGTSFLEC